MIVKNVALAGGDMRQLYAADAFAEKGFCVYLCGFDRLRKQPGQVRLKDAFEKADIVLLPITGIKGHEIPTEYSDKELKLTEDLLDILKAKPVFMGRGDTLGNIRGNIRIYDILSREDFAVANALPTAEGAVQVAMENYPGLICNSNCLVTGFGRIGRILSCILKSLSARVTVSARKPEHLAYVTAQGNTALNTGELKSLTGFDMVFNTVPGLIIDENVLKNTAGEPLIIDLASLPGGVDFTAAQRLNIKALHALSLPGKCAPKAAGKIICDTILTVLKEEYKWQRQL